MYILHHIATYTPHGDGNSPHFCTAASTSFIATYTPHGDGNALLFVKFKLRIDCNLHPSRGRKPYNLDNIRNRSIATYTPHGDGNIGTFLSRLKSFDIATYTPHGDGNTAAILHLSPVLDCNLHPSRGRHTKNEADRCLVFFTFFCFTIFPVYAIIKSTERGSPRKARRRRAADCEQEESP